MAYRGCLTLYCGHCNTGLATLDILMLATVPPSATHMAIKKEKEEEAYKTLRKIPNPDAKKASFSPYKILCKQCNDYVGTVSIVHENTLICFKIENVYFKKGYEEIRGKRLKHIKEKLLRYGLEVVNISQLQLPDAIEQNETPSEPLIYCDVRNGLTKEQVFSFTKQIPRGYQLEMFLEALRGNTLVYLPTGSGKTLIAAMVLSCMKKLNPNKLMVFLVDRIPLVYQQSDYIKSQVPDLRVEILAGDVGRFPGDKSRWIATVQALAENKIDLLVLTHQILLNLMASDPVVVRMSDISVLVFDEAHHCLGNHCYNQVMRDFYRVTSNRCKPLVLALTASPAGADTLQATSKKLEELLSNLSACGRMPSRSTDLEVYWNRPDTEYQMVPLNTKQTVFESNVELYLNSLKELIEWEAKCPRALDKLQVLKHNYRGALRKLIERCYGDKSRVKGLALGEHAMHMLSVIEVNNILGNEYAVECLEECIKQLRMATSPLERLKKKVVGSLNALKVLESSIQDLRRVSSFFALSDRYQHLTKELENFILRVEKDETSRGIIFVKMRRTAHKLCERLRKETEICEKLNPAFLVGHGRGSDGMDWRGEQEEILKKLRSGEVKLLVSTSVLEEGLDVPVCNLVIRFDSALTVRGIVQSRGRASRRPDSRFVVICSDCKEQTNAFDAIEIENNMERAMRLQQYFTARLQAESFGCEMKKPDLSQRSHLVEPPNMACTEEEPQAEEEDDDVENEYSVEAMTIHERGESLASGGPRKRRKKRVPNVRIAIFNVVTDRNNNKEVSQLTEYFERYFDLKSLAPETSEVVKDSESSAGEEESTSDQSHSVILRLQLEPCEDQIFRKKEKFFTHIVQSWCSRPKAYRSETEKHWLCRDEPSQSQKYSKQVLVIKAEAINLGYFWNRAHFCIHWPFNSTRRMENIRVAFQHDLRTLLICFTMANPFSKWKADLYKLQIRYSELREFVLVDKRSSSSSQEVIISLRHPPRIYRAKNLIKKEQDDEENDFEDWYFDENDYDFDFDDDRGFSSEYSSDSEDDQTTSGVNRSSAESTQVKSEDDTEALLTSSDLARIDDVVNWERVTEIGDSGEAFGLCFAYNFTFKASEWQHVKEVLKSIARYDKKSFFVSMRKSVRRLPEVNISKELPFVVKYAAQCVLSSFPFARGRITTKFATLLGSKPEKTTLSALERLGTALHRNLFCDPEARLEALLNETNLNLGGFPKQLLPDQCAMIKRMVITPTRLLYYTPEIMSKNRVLRNYNTDQFLCVNFRDEDFSRLSSAAGAIDNILERLRRILDSGVIAGGDRFLFLGSSNSQLRNHGCWFVRPSPQPEEIRNWMGDFSRIRY